MGKRRRPGQGATGGALAGALRAAFDAAGAPQAGEHVLVAVSGGPDSTALLLALVDAAPERGLRLTAAHLDHGLRGASGTAEGAAVASLAATLGVPVVSRTLALTGGAGVAARARQARYRTLVAIARDVGATRIATGHTLDDQVETLLLRLLRGAGRRGLGAMRPVRGRLWRPLLAATRADVRRFLADRGVGFAVDPTNADLRHARSRVRRLLVPLLREEFNPRLEPALGALATRLHDEEDWLAAAAAARTATLVVDGALRAAVAAEPPALGRRVVRAWLERGTRGGVTAAHVERVLALAGGRGRGVVAVSGPSRVLREGALLVRRQGRAPQVEPFRLVIAPGEAVAHAEAGWRLVLSPPRSCRPDEARTGDAMHALFDADALPAGLVVRSPAAGDRLRLAGGGSRKLQDVLVDAKVPREARATVPVLAADGDVLWVAGLARGAVARIQPATRRVVEAVLERTR